MRGALALAAAAIVACPLASDRGPPVADSLAALLRAAWRDGTATARMASGPLPAMFRDFHMADGPLVVEARRGEPFPEPGCARYEVVFTQLGARLESGLPGGRATLTASLSHCVDGSAPGSGIDLDLFGELMGRRGR